MGIQWRDPCSPGDNTQNQSCISDMFIFNWFTTKTTKRFNGDSIYLSTKFATILSAITFQHTRWNIRQIFLKTHTHSDFKWVRSKWPRKLFTTHPCGILWGQDNHTSATGDGHVWRQHLQCWDGISSLCWPPVSPGQVIPGHNASKNRN